MRSSFRTGLGAAVLGTLLVAMGIVLDPRRALTAYLFAYAAVLTVVLGAAFQLMIGHLTDARWFVALRGPTLAIMGAMPALAMLALPILLGVRVIYPWALPATLSPEARAIVAHKASWLNVPFFLVRSVIYLVVWTVILELLRRRSFEGGGSTAPVSVPRELRLRRVSAVGSIVAGLALTFAAFDWFMSLEPTWYSTIYGVYVFAGGFLAALALIAVLANRPADIGAKPTGAQAERETSALATLLLTFVIFWAYIGFSQYLIIWIGDLPTDVSWYVTRTRGSWGVVAAAIGIGQFGLPLVLLLPYALKRKAGFLAGLGVWLLAMHVLDSYWLVLPALEPAGMRVSWMDAGALLMVVGVAVASAAWRHAPYAAVHNAGRLENYQTGK